MSSSGKTLRCAALFAIGAAFAFSLFAQDPGALLVPRDKGVTAEQRANVRERVALANSILDRHQAEAESLGLSSGWRQPLLQQLLPLPVSALKTLEGAGSLDELSSAAAKLAVNPLAIWTPSEDLIYLPITPCRYIDTRIAGGKITGSRAFDIANAGSTYGGDVACNPLTKFNVAEDRFGALAMNVTIYGPDAAPGFAAIKPTTAAPTTSVVNWYEAGPSVQVANQAILTLDHSSAIPEFYIVTSSSTHVIVDLFGAFVPRLASGLTIAYVDNTQTIAPGQTLFAASGICPIGVGASLTGGGALIPQGVTTVVLKYSYPDDLGQWQCGWRNDGPSNVVVKCRAICATIPGR